MANSIHGKNGAIYIEGIKVTEKTEWSLNLSRDFADVTTFRDGNKVYAAGLRDVQGTFAGFLDVSGDAALTYSDGSAYAFQLWAEDGMTLVAEGPAYLDATVTASISDAIRCSGNFRAAGTWSIYLTL